MDSILIEVLGFLLLALATLLVFLPPFLYKLIKNILQGKENITQHTLTFAMKITKVNAAALALIFLSLLVLSIFGSSIGAGFLYLLALFILFWSGLCSYLLEKKLNFFEKFAFSLFTSAIMLYLVSQLFKGV
jgi:hypothetical protein